jgi:hypothetical protein
LSPELKIDELMNPIDLCYAAEALEATAAQPAPQPALPRRNKMPH